MKLCAAIERIEKNLNGCSNQGQVLSAVQEMDFNLEIKIRQSSTKLSRKETPTMMKLLATMKECTWRVSSLLIHLKYGLTILQ